jgi:hypothetical protein
LVHSQSLPSKKSGRINGREGIGREKSKIVNALIAKPLEQIANQNF